jgi:hypothetical protein
MGMSSQFEELFGDKRIRLAVRPPRLEKTSWSMERRDCIVLLVERAPSMRRGRFESVVLGVPKNISFFITAGRGSLSPGTKVRRSSLKESLCEI